MCVVCFGLVAVSITVRGYRLFTRCQATGAQKNGPPPQRAVRFPILPEVVGVLCFGSLGWVLDLSFRCLGRGVLDEEREFLEHFGVVPTLTLGLLDLLVDGQRVVLELAGLRFLPFGVSFGVEGGVAVTVLLAVPAWGLGLGVGFVGFFHSS
jgi:hypothetical protein